MTWRRWQIDRFGGPEVLRLVEEEGMPAPGPGEALVRVLAAGTGFTDTFIRRGRYPDVKGPLPLTLGYDLVGIVEAAGAGVTLAPGTMVADLCVTGGYTQYAVRPAAALVPVPGGVDPAEAVAIPLAYMTAYQMLVRYRRLAPGATILVIGASGTVGTALLDLARHFGLKAVGTCSGVNMDLVRGYGATAIDYRAGPFEPAVRAATGGRGVDMAFDAIGGAHFARSYACLAPGGLLVGYGSQTMATGDEGLLSAALGLGRLKLYAALSPLTGRSGVFYAITARRKTHPAEFTEDMAALFDLLKAGRITPAIAGRYPLSAAREIHDRLEKGGLRGKAVLLPWAEEA